MYHFAKRSVVSENNHYFNSISATLPAEDEQVKSLRPELNGRRIVSEDGTSAWIVFHGMRHHVHSSAVYESLFRPELSFETPSEHDSIVDGPDLTTGTCLVSNRESGEIFLVFGAPAINIRKYLIETYETFIALGFNENLVHAIPPIVLAAIPSGRSIRMEVHN